MRERRWGEKSRSRKRFAHPPTHSLHTIDGPIVSGMNLELEPIVEVFLRVTTSGLLVLSLNCSELYSDRPFSSLSSGVLVQGVQQEHRIPGGGKEKTKEPRE